MSTGQGVPDHEKEVATKLTGLDWTGQESCYLDLLFDQLPTLRYTKIWRGAIKYEHRYLCEATVTHLVHWHNREFFLEPLAERNHLYAEVQSCWEECELCSALSSPTSALFSNLSGAFFG